MQKCKAKEILEGMTAVAQNFKNSFSQKCLQIGKIIQSNNSISFC